MAEYTYGKDFAIRTETDCIATGNDFVKYVGRITAVKIKTNADKIRAMSDEELAEWYWWMLKYVQGYTDSRCALLEWLRKEADDTQH